MQELGWSGGQETGNKQPKCLIPLAAASGNVLVGATSSGSVVAFDIVEPEVGNQEPRFEEFGTGAGAEACGNVNLTPPLVEHGEVHEATEAPVGTPVKLASKLEGADALSVTWTIAGPGGIKEELHSKFTAQAQRIKPSIEHTFTAAGEYEVTETVQTDNLGTQSVTAKQKIVATLVGITFKLEPTATVRAGEPLELKTGKIEDGNEPEPKLTVTWTFGDGTPVVEQKVEGKGKSANVTHTFAAPGTPTVTVKVKDAKGAEASASHQVTVGKSVKEEEEEHITTTGTTSTTPPPPPPPPPGHEKHDPAAGVAGASVSVASNGTASIAVSCPSDEEAACEGTITLRTLTAVSAAKKKAKKAILTLASGSFRIAGGSKKTIVLHLSSRARALLARSHTLRVLAIVLAHDAANVSDRTEARVTLHLAKKRH